jgi:hypothetical protein
MCLYALVYFVVCFVGGLCDCLVVSLDSLCDYWLLLDDVCKFVLH